MFGVSARENCGCWQAFDFMFGGGRGHVDRRGKIKAKNYCSTRFTFDRGEARRHLFEFIYVISPNSFCRFDRRLSLSIGGVACAVQYKCLRISHIARSPLTPAARSAFREVSFPLIVSSSGNKCTHASIKQANSAEMEHKYNINGPMLFLSSRFSSSAFRVVAKRAAESGSHVCGSVLLPLSFYFP